MPSLHKNEPVNDGKQTKAERIRIQRSVTSRICFAVLLGKCEAILHLYICMYTYGVPVNFKDTMIDNN